MIQMLNRRTSLGSQASWESGAKRLAWWDQEPRRIVSFSTPLPHTQPFIWAWDGTFDVGLDTGTSVDYSDYHVPFAFAGELEKITFDLGETRS